MPRTLLGIQHVVDFSKMDKHIAKVELFIHSNDEIQNPKSKLEVCADIWQLYWNKDNSIKYVHHPYILVDLERQIFYERKSKQANERLNSAPNRLDAFRDIEAILERIRNGNSRQTA